MAPGIPRVRTHGPVPPGRPHPAVALGERVVSDRKLRRAGRDAASLAEHAARAQREIDEQARADEGQVRDD